MARKVRVIEVGSHAIKPRRPLKPTPLSRRLVRRLAAAGLVFPGGEENYYISRTYAGRKQKEAWGWVWSLIAIKPFRITNIGSVETVTDLMKAPAWSVDLDRHGEINLYVGKGPGDTLKKGWSVSEPTNLHWPKASKKGKR